MEITMSEIKDKVSKCICPGAYYCVIASTCYSPVRREHECTCCWLDHCHREKINVIED